MKRRSLLLIGLVAACDGSPDISEATDAASEATQPEAALVAEEAGVVEEAGSAAANDVTVPGDAPDAPDPCAGESVPPSTLACTGLYSDFANKEIAKDALEYAPSTSLWSDGAQKQRWIKLPPNSQIDISNRNEWKFPVGTRLFKEFRVQGKRVETRMFQKVDATFWNYATYAWSRDDSAAPIHFGGPVPVGDTGATWNIPSNDDCSECHRGRQDRILGFEAVSLGMGNAQGLTLARLSEMGLVTPAPAQVSLSIGNDGTGLNAPALAWIHVNCGVTCHNANPSAAGYGAAMNLRLDPAQLDGSPPDLETWPILKTTLGVPCVSGSIIGQIRIQPGDVANSVIYRLMSQRGTLQMPPIATTLIDTPNVAVVAAWIRSLAPADAGPPDVANGSPNADASVIDTSLVADDGGPDAPDESGPDEGVTDANDAGASGEVGTGIDEVEDAEALDGGNGDAPTIDEADGS